MTLWITENQHTAHELCEELHINPNTYSCRNREWYIFHLGMNRTKLMGMNPDLIIDTSAEALPLWLVEEIRILSSRGNTVALAGSVLS